MSEDNEMIKGKIKFYLDNSKPIHIIKNDGVWYNGYVLQLENEDYFLFNEFKFGEMPVFYSEIKRLENYTSPKGE